MSEGGVAAGVRRIEAITGEAALEYVEQSDVAAQGSGRPGARLARRRRRQGARRARAHPPDGKGNPRAEGQARLGQGTDLASGAVDVQGVKVVATKVDGADAGALRNAVDQLKDRLKSAVVVLASVESPTKVVLVAGVTADLVARIKAGELVGSVAAQGRRPRRRPAGFRAGGRQRPRSAGRGTRRRGILRAHETRGVASRERSHS